MFEPHTTETETWPARLTSTPWMRASRRPPLRLRAGPWRRRYPRTRGSQSTSGIWSTAARWTRRENGSASSSPFISGARHALRISISVMRPTPTRPSRTPSSRCFLTSRRIAKPGPSRSGSRGFSSTAVSTAAKRGAGATAGSWTARRRARTKPASRRPGRQPILNTASWRASGTRASRRPSTAWTAASGPCSCCATTAIARRAKSVS